MACVHTHTHICYTITNTHTGHDMSRRWPTLVTWLHLHGMWVFTAPLFLRHLWGLHLCLQVRETSTIIWECVYPLHAWCAAECVFLPGAVFTVDIASERHLVVLKVVLSLLCDADLFEHGIWHIIIHLGCKRTRENSVVSMQIDTEKICMRDARLKH